MIYITGDTHGKFDRIEYFCNDNKTTKEDVLIILGDVGINYYGGSRDRHTKEYLSNLPITLFCIKGNHENYAGNISTYTNIQFYSGNAFIEYDYPNLIFAKDGEIYNFNNKKCIVIGGAYSVDKFYRLERGFNWFKDEQPSEDTKKFVENQLQKIDWNIDIVLSHTCPIRYEPIELFLPFDLGFVDKSTEMWLDDIYKKLIFDKWYFGHYHGEKSIDKMRLLFNDIIELY